MTRSPITDSLRLKTYFSSSVEAALELARQELGPDAMLLNSRSSPAEARHLGNYEVVFALLPTDGQPISRPAGLRAALSALEFSVASLVRAGIEPQLASTIMDGNPESVVACMEGMIRAEAVVAKSSGASEIAAFIGPPGRGKTTTLVKIAITHGIAQRKPIRIYSVDYLRVGAAASLRILAGILGVHLELFQSVSALDHALRNPLAGMTLIDTPGFGPRDHDAAQDLARCLTAHPSVERHLVLRADSSHAALQETIERFAPFEPTRLIFTGLDETTTAGGVYSAAVRARLPISFLTNGQSIPEDLESASASRVVELALGSSNRASLAAA